MLTNSFKRLTLTVVASLTNLGLLVLLSNSAVLAQTPNVGNITTQPEDIENQVPEALKTLALQRVAARTGVPPTQLEIVHTNRPTFPLLGRSGFGFKMIDKRDGTIYDIALDSTGQELDTEQLFVDERTARIAKNGKLSSELAHRLANAPADELIPVIVRLQGPPPAQPELPRPRSNVTSEQVDAILRQVTAQRSAAVGVVVAPVADRLRQLGYDVETNKYVPLLYARLTPKVIREVEGWNEVVSISLNGINQQELEVARPTIGADVVHNRGYTGSGVRAAQIELGGRIATSNPYLQSDQSVNSQVVQDTTFVCPSPSTHSTAVAGIIRSTHPSQTGIAPTASLWAGGSCNGLDSELQDRSIAASDWGAKVINLSWGRDIGLLPADPDNFYDDMVINYRRTIVKSAGNNGSTCQTQTGNVTSPGLAYNIITVGAFDDRNTTSWSDDAMYSCSSWRNPSSSNGDREKPEVVAPGVNINSTTTSSPWTGNVSSGTSLAAPMVTGTVALMIRRDSTLELWPEAIKAILMATAVHNIEGSTRLSEFDGAGGIVASRADDVLTGASGGYSASDYFCSNPTPNDMTTMSLTGGTRTRVAIAWDTDPDYVNYASKPSSDYDLQVISPSGTVVAGSYSYDNTYEIVDFTPSSTGNYKLRVARKRCEGRPSFYLGYAWYKGN